MQVPPLYFPTLYQTIREDPMLLFNVLQWDNQIYEKFCLLLETILIIENSVSWSFLLVFPSILSIEMGKCVEHLGNNLANATVTANSKFLWSITNCSRYRWNVLLADFGKMRCSSFILLLMHVLKIKTALIITLEEFTFQEISLVLIAKGCLNTGEI